MRSDHEETGSRRQEFGENVPEILVQRLLPCAGGQPSDRGVFPLVLWNRPACQGPRLDRERPHHRQPLLYRGRRAQVIARLVSERSLRTGQWRRASALARLAASFDWALM